MAFNNCLSLKSISIPNGVTEISECLLSGCENLTEILLPEDITVINNQAFWGCSNHVNIILPDKITLIDIGVFRECNKLENVFYCGNAQDWAEIEIKEDMNSDLLEANIYYYSETKPTDEGLYWHYVDGEVVVW